VPTALIVALNGLVVVFVVAIDASRRRYLLRTEAPAGPTPEGRLEASDSEVRGIAPPDGDVRAAEIGEGPRVASEGAGR